MLPLKLCREPCLIVNVILRRALSSIILGPDIIFRCLLSRFLLLAINGILGLRRNSSPSQRNSLASWSTLWKRLLWVVVLLWNSIGVVSLLIDDLWVVLFIENLRLDSLACILGFIDLLLWIFLVLAVLVSSFLLLVSLLVVFNLPFDCRFNILELFWHASWGRAWSLIGEFNLPSVLLGFILFNRWSLKWFFTLIWESWLGPTSFSFLRWSTCNDHG